MTIAKIISAIGLAAMTLVLFLGFTQGDFFEDGTQLLQNPWGVVSMVDLYVGFFLFSGWIIYREENWMTASVWVIFMMVLGFFTGSLYVLVNLFSSKGDWKRFWLGKNS